MKRRRRITRSSVRKRSISIGGHRTSISLEDEFWQGLREIARIRVLPLSNFLADIDGQRVHTNLSSVIRVLVLEHYRRLAEEAAPGGKRQRP